MESVSGADGQVRNTKLHELDGKVLYLIHVIAPMSVNMSDCLRLLGADRIGVRLSDETFAGDPTRQRLTAFTTST